MHKDNYHTQLEDFYVTKEQRIEKYNQKPCLLWFTGLSGSGKSTIAKNLEQELFKQNYLVQSLDGDNIRQGLNKDLGMSQEDRTENIRRIGEVAKLFTQAGHIVTASFISPYREDRDQARALFPQGEFLEVYVNTPLEVCEQRDVKGLYKKAREGLIKNFTGIDAPYEAPINPEIELKTDNMSISQSVTYLLDELKKRGYLQK